MDSTIILSTGLTAAVGLAGILSTHLLARAHRKAESARETRERTDQYRFAEFGLRSQLYADYTAELKTLLLRARLRLSVVPNARRKFRDGLGDDLRAKADQIADDQTRSGLLAVAELFERDDSFRQRLQEGVDDGLPPRIEMLPVISRLGELQARITLVGTQEMVQASAVAQAAAISFLMRLEASEIANFDDVPSLEELERAAARVEEAAIFELRLSPYGEKKTLAELRTLAQQSVDPPTHGS